MNYLANRMSVIKPSASMVVSQAAKRLAATGVDVIDLGLGEPDFAAPDHVTETSFAAAGTRRMLYTASTGTVALREAITDKLRRENGLDYDTDEIAVANGAKQVIFNALMATLNEGDEVILPAPYYVTYPEVAKLFGGVPVTPACDAADGFRISPEALDAVITPRTKWVFLNSPGNPSGAVYSRKQLAELGEVLARHPHVLVASDEIYEHIIFDGRPFTSFGQACPQLRDRTLIVNGVSKSYAMTGWRVGYGAGPRDLIKAMGTIQSQCCTSVSAPAQIAAQAALEGPQDEVAKNRVAYERRRNLVVNAVADIDGLTLAAPEGAFYAYIGCDAVIGATTPQGDTLADDQAVATYLLNEAHVAVVPGAAYGLSPFVRISTATSETVLEDAMRRIGSAVNKLSLLRKND